MQQGQGTSLKEAKSFMHEEADIANLNSAISYYCPVAFAGSSLYSWPGDMWMQWNKIYHWFFHTASYGQAWEQVHSGD